MKNQIQKKNEIVACVGSSTAAAHGVFNWLKELKQRPQNSRFTFVNRGVGGDVAYSTLQRLPKTIALHPDRVILIIGANDILNQVFPNVQKMLGGWKKLPEKSSPKWFRENLTAIVSELKAKTSARVGLVSLALVGEDPNSSNPKQAELNKLFAEFAEIIKDVAKQEGVDYIPFYERFEEQLVTDPGKAFTEFRFRSFFRDYYWREFIRRHTFDEIAEMNGWKYHVDGVHLNTRGGMILADVVQEFLDK
ncbi:MAG TPA: GDSL-type esterase/lipase family protein [Candidatus Chromulinivoraceae bacterium]|nr:GDSL-type esterase/lipase family protein [Candidatus Chromulinivoraceae bacterium]